MSIMDRIRKGIDNLDKAYGKTEKKEQKKAKFDLSKALDTLEEGYSAAPRKKSSGVGIAGKLDQLEAAYSRPQSGGGFWNNTQNLGSTMPGNKPFYESKVSMNTSMPSTAMGSSLGFEKRKRKKKEDED